MSLKAQEGQSSEECGQFGVKQQLGNHSNKLRVRFSTSQDQVERDSSEDLFYRHLKMDYKVPISTKTERHSSIKFSFCSCEITLCHEI